jgi:probable F420-dependent oxidoreductase
MRGTTDDLGRYGLTVFTGGRGADRYRRMADLAHRAEAAGFGAVWTGELYNRSATVPMAVLGQATERVVVGSNIAYGVGRSPLIWAVEARDLDELTEGRLVLGLGNGTPAMMENWLGVSGESPAARMEELVTVLRELWRLHEGPVHHEGRFYRLHLAPPADTPPPYREHLPIWTAAVGPRMARAAGRVADGLVAHPMATPEYLDEVVRPELARGAAEAGRSLDGFVVKGYRMCAVDDDVEVARRRIAFAIGQYAASRVYDRLFALHGWEAAQQRIRAAAKEGDPQRMAAEVPDDAVDAIGIACTAGEFPERAAAHAVHLDHLDLCAAPWGLAPDELEASTVAIVDALSHRAPAAATGRIHA